MGKKSVKLKILLLDDFIHDEMWYLWMRESHINFAYYKDENFVNLYTNGGKHAMWI